MNHFDCSPFRRPCRPEPPVEPDGVCPSAFLMQRILASGHIHRRNQCYPVCLSGLPAQAQAPFTVTDVLQNGDPVWQEDGCPSVRGMTLRLSIPLAVRLRDACGCAYSVSSCVEEKLHLRPEGPPQECWRGQVYLQSAVRLSSRCAPCGDAQCSVPLEVIVCGYLLCACPSRSPAPLCADPRPLYPHMPCPRSFFD